MHKDNLKLSYIQIEYDMENKWTIGSHVPPSDIPNKVLSEEL